MAAKLNILTARTVAGNLAPGKHSDGGNLYLVVGKSGAKSWLFIYRFGGKQREMGLGRLENVPLSAAREKAAAARMLLGQNIDPLEHRAEEARRVELAAAAEKAEAAKSTFGNFAIELLDGYVEKDARGREKRVPGLKEGFRNAKHAAQWESTLREYAAPIWDLKLDDIDVDGVLKCVAPIWKDKNETARRVRGRIEAVLTAAIARRLRPGPNPAALKGNLEALLPRVSKLQRGHHPALPWPEIPAFWTKLAALDSVSARALAFTILTAARSGETRGATWGEIDLDAAVWTIPASRMKAAREHTVPLSDAALVILAEVEKIRLTDDPSELVFPSVRDRVALSDMAISMCCRGLRGGITVHGFRSTFRDWAGDATSFPRELAEQALAHTVGGVEGAYRRGAALEKRRVMMEAWADHVTGKLADNVIRLEIKSY